MYIHLTTYKNNIVFIIRQALIRDYYAAEILYYFLCILQQQHNLLSQVSWGRLDMKPKRDEK
jgi:hypothetical protein